MFVESQLALHVDSALRLDPIEQPMRSEPPFTSSLLSIGPTFCRENSFVRIQMLVTEQLQCILDAGVFTNAQIIESIKLEIAELKERLVAPVC